MVRGSSQSQSSSSPNSRPGLVARLGSATATAGILHRRPRGTTTKGTGPTSTQLLPSLGLDLPLEPNQGQQSVPKQIGISLSNLIGDCKPVDLNDLRRIQNIVNDQIAAKLDVFSKEVYPNQVRVVAIGKKIDNFLADPENDEWTSIFAELCGEAKAFAILSKEGIAKGIRRIISVTTDKASEARELANFLEKEVDDASKGRQLARKEIQITLAFGAQESQRLATAIWICHRIRSCEQPGSLEIL
uniref:alanine--tRNA ligase n=1 Tax=Cannabis sativa TaxID=3483 RepID=A0A803NL16_CANSA